MDLCDIVKRLQCPSSDWATTALAVRNISLPGYRSASYRLAEQKLSAWCVARAGYFPPCAAPLLRLCFLDDQAIEAFWDEPIRAIYKRTAPLQTAAKSLARYIYMYTTGGIYADTDTRVVKPADHWNLREGDSFVVGLEADFSSDAVAHEWVYARARSASLHAFVVSPKNPLLQRGIETVVTNSKTQ